MSSIESFKKTYGGLILSITSISMLAFSIILIKKFPFYSGFDLSLVRFIFMFIVLILVAKFKKINIFGSPDIRKILIIRGALGSIGMPIHFTSLNLIDPSDTISVFSCNVVVVIIISRIYFKESISLAQIAAAFFILSGVILIAQPSFLFSKPLTTKNDTLEMISLNQTIIQSSDTTIKSVGLSLALCSGVIHALCTIVIKTASKANTHYSVINLYACYFGIPVSLFLSTGSVFTGFTPKNVSMLTEPEFLWETVYFLLSVVLSVFAQIIWVISLKLDDAAKITMYRSTDLMFTFIMQYIFLGIEPDSFKILGAFLISAGIVGSVGFKMINERVEKNKLASGDQSKTGCLKKVVFYKI